jgi:hypothetical protein
LIGLVVVSLLTSEPDFARLHIEKKHKFLAKARELKHLYFSHLKGKQ